MSPPKILELPSLSNTITFSPNHATTQPTTLVLTETTSGYDFDITDRETGQILFTVKGMTDSQVASKEIFDTKGRLVFALRKQNSWNPKWYRLEAPDGSPFTSVEWSWSTTAKMTLRFTNTVTGRPVKMCMNANYFSRNGDWKIDDQVVAHVFRDFYTTKDLWKGKRTYYLSVAPGMDMAVALAACLYLHERVNEATTQGSSATAAATGAGVAGACA